MVTLIVNYFVGQSLKTEIKEYASFQEAMKRVEELKSEGIILSRSNYGVYKFNITDVIEVLA